MRNEKQTGFSEAKTLEYVLQPDEEEEEEEDAGEEEKQAKSNGFCVVWAT